MPLSAILSQPAVGLAWVAAILVALSLHEFAHAVIATRLGDTTAEDAGRVTINPLAHVDLLGFLMLLLVGFGWGKPVPFDPSRLRSRRWGPVLVAFAGPLMNLCVMIAAGIALRALERGAVFPPSNLLIIFLAFAFQINLVLLLFNLIPIPPLDGSKLLLSALDRPQYDHARFFLETRGPLLLLGLIILDSFLGGALIGAPMHAAMQLVAGWF